MTLEEAIKRFEKLASDYEFNLDMHQLNIMKLSVNDIERMKRNAQENRQLAEWLKELKKYRIAHWKLRDMDYEYDFDSMFGDNPMFYGEKVWDLFGDIDASVEYEVMQYEEVNADE